LSPQQPHSITCGATWRTVRACRLFATTAGASPIDTGKARLGAAGLTKYFTAARARPSRSNEDRAGNAGLRTGQVTIVNHIIVCQPLGSSVSAGSRMYRSESELTPIRNIST